MYSAVMKLWSVVLYRDYAVVGEKWTSDQETLHQADVLPPLFQVVTRKLKMFLKILHEQTSLLFLLIADSGANRSWFSGVLHDAKLIGSNATNDSTFTDVK